MYLSNRGLLQYSSVVNGTIIFDILLYITMSFFQYERASKTKIVVPKEGSPVFHIFYNPSYESLSIWEVSSDNYKQLVNPSFFSETINFSLLEGNDYDLSELVFDKILLLQARIEKFCGKHSSSKFMDKLCNNNANGEKLKLCLSTNY